MAQAKTKTRKISSTAKPRKSPPVHKRGTSAPAASPHRREIGAVVCLLLGVFSLIGCFSTDGAFIGFFCGIIKGLLGWGFFAVPPILILCFLILAFHRGRPVCFRVTCALMLSVLTAALLHLFLCSFSYNLAHGMAGALWADGKSLKCGGVAGGALSEAFRYLFGKTGAAIVLICGMIFLLLASLNKTISGLADAFKNREKREYVPEPAPAPRQESFNSKSGKPEKRRANIDIPVDGAVGQSPTGTAAEFELPKRSAFFSAIPRVKTPDQMLSDNGEGQPQPDLKTDEAPTDQAAANNTAAQPEITFANRKDEETEKPSPAAELPTQQADIPVPKKVEKAAPEPFKPPEKPAQDSPASSYVFPTVDLLTSGAASGRIDGTEEVRLNSERLEAAFKSFGINVKISNATRGPTVTRYEAELEAGIKLNRLTSLSDDIALSLGTSGVRIAAMPNKISTVGIEVPNKLVSKVYLRDIIDSREFKSAPSKLTFAIGKNIGGDAIVGNVAKLPHMLVAGTTGSGKSVCLNSLILSILYKATPDDVRFIMIDPKMVEFRVYNGIPHLLVPVVTEVKKASGALQWAVVEMMKRYRLFSDTGARDIESYNKSIINPEDGEKLPQIIVVIDELADLMLSAAKEVEESICRVAQMGRAAGVHLIIATQSPRADVITGLMKANIPSRIALKVSSALESRIILDAGGNAEKLVGNGDMLYAPIGTTKPIRIQGTWVSDSEREKVVDFIKQNGITQYSEEVIDQIDKAAEDKGSDSGSGSEPSANDYDELLPQAVEVIFECGQASVSMLQRRLKLGYSRAARLVDQMEQLGVVGPFEGSKPRQILITRQQWREMQLINGTAPTDTIMPEPDDFSAVQNTDGEVPF